MPLVRPIHPHLPRRKCVGFLLRPPLRAAPFHEVKPERPRVRVRAHRRDHPRVSRPPEVRQLGQEGAAGEHVKILTKARVFHCFKNNTVVGGTTPGAECVKVRCFMARRHPNTSPLARPAASPRSAPPSLPSPRLALPYPMQSLRRFAFWLTFLLSLCSLRAQEIQRIRDVVYARHDGVALTLDVYKPAKPNGAGIIKIISGGWKSSHAQINDTRWSQAGYTTFVVVHGSQSRYQVAEIVADLHRAVRFIRAHASRYGVDPGKLGVTGTSAGGHLSLMLATRGGPGDPQAADPIDRLSSAVQAAAFFYPPTDYLNWFADGDNAVGIGRLAEYAGAFGPLAATPEGREKLGRELSPVYWVNSAQPPVYIVHGDADPQVSVTQARRFFKRSGEVGAKCEVLVREGGGHGGWSEMSEDGARMKEWFDLHLLAREPARPFTFTLSSAPSTPAKKKPPANTLTPEETAEGWRLLFDGQTTAGWRGYGGAELPPKWEVRDGALSLMKYSPPGAAGGEGTGIVTTDEFTDFDCVGIGNSPSAATAESSTAWPKTSPNRTRPAWSISWWTP